MGPLPMDPKVHAMRHSCAHVMAAAIQKIRPDAIFGVGPPVSNGFYYDVVTDPPLSKEELSEIEKLMEEIKTSGLPIERSSMSADEALRYYRSKGQIFKAELIENLKSHGTAYAIDDIDDDAVFDSTGIDEVSIYTVGDFADLCAGPHVGHTTDIGYFKLTSISGAYWRGDSSKKQLQRVKGLCYPTKSGLEAEMDRLEDAAQRDHRVLGQKHKLYTTSNQIGQGLPVWLPAGTVIRDELEYLAKEAETKAGYVRVSTPHLAKSELYHKSGHLPYYEEDMYPPIPYGASGYYLRPMNCPHHHQVYLSDKRSYKDLPYRIAEYGQVYRHEDSGALSGLMRTRGFCQNDAHIYCREDQAVEEFTSVMNMHKEHYELFKIEDFWMRLSLPDDKNVSKYVDDPNAWERAKDIIVSAMDNSGVPYEKVLGEAAFYGPKVDFIIKSAAGVEYAISTSQLDFVASDRFGLSYVGPDGRDHPVYVIHRAPLGSHERFVAFLVEHTKATFPFWLSPEQIRIIPVSNDSMSYAESLHDRIRSKRVLNGTASLRATVDMSSSRIPKKIRSAISDRVPVMWILGQKEQASDAVTIRLLDGQEENMVDADIAIHASVEAAGNRRDSLAVLDRIRQI